MAVAVAEFSCVRRFTATMCGIFRKGHSCSQMNSLTRADRLFNWLPEKPLLKMPHADGGETSNRREFNYTPGLSSSDNRDLHNPLRYFSKLEVLGIELATWWLVDRHSDYLPTKRSWHDDNKTKWNARWRQIFGTNFAPWPSFMAWIAG